MCLKISLLFFYHGHFERAIYDLDNGIFGFDKEIFGLDDLLYGFDHWIYHLDDLLYGWKMRAVRLEVRAVRFEELGAVNQDVF